MCDPFTASVALSVASNAVSYSAQSKQAKYQNALAVQQGEEARASTINQYSASHVQDIQRDAQTAQQLDENQRQASQSRARAVTAAGEAGVAGVSVDALLGDLYRQEARNADGYRYNNTMDAYQADQNRIGIEAQGKARTNDAASRTTYGPSLLGSALRIGGDVVSAGAKYKGWGSE